MRYVGKTLFLIIKGHMSMDNVPLPIPIQLRVTITRLVQRLKGKTV